MVLLLSISFNYATWSMRIALWSAYEKKNKGKNQGQSMQLYRGKR